MLRTITCIYVHPIVHARLYTCARVLYALYACIVQSEGVALPSEELASRATKETTVKSWLVMRPTESLSLLRLYRRRVQPFSSTSIYGHRGDAHEARNGFEVNALTGSNDQGPTLGWTGRHGSDASTEFAVERLALRNC